MTEKTDRYRETIFLPKTAFPMKAGLPQKEPELLKRWAGMDMYRRLREQAKGREKFVLHDGPPYANGNIHIGHALNKILKDIVTRSRQMAGYDSNYVPGWDCHGLPIEWKIEEQYRAKGRNKDAVPVNEFRQECRQFAEHWIGVQREEFKRLGVEGDWDDPYLTMDYKSEALIAKELMKFAASGQLYRGSKPVMWSVVEKTALAEAEIEYQDYVSDQIWVKFPVANRTFHRDLTGSGNDTTALNTSPDAIPSEHQIFVVIWTTTPWTIPGNRAISFSQSVKYGLYEVVANSRDFGPNVGERHVLADALVEQIGSTAKLTYKRLLEIPAHYLEEMICAHPFKGFASGYDFDVPLLEGSHVTEDAGTGFVHTAPGHGSDDFNVWVEKVGGPIPFTVDADGVFTKEAPGFEGKRVITDKGEKGDANEAVIRALIDAGMLVARGRLTHQYPHSWRSKKPIIFRNTPQWFIAMGDGKPEGLRAKALKAIDDTEFFPSSGQNRLRGMIESRPDWVISRQRAWGVPITVFVKKDGGVILNDEKVNQRILDAFEAEGADAWFAEGAAQRFLGNERKAEDYEQVRDILDVWFDSGSTHAFCLEQRPDLKWPADVYLEGSDQHRGWFHSSLLESCGTRGRAPYDQVITHGFTMAEDGRKMSKSLGNIVAPQEVIKNSGADILRLWTASVDYADDQRIGPEILKNTIESYRKLRNTFRYLLGALEGLKDWEIVPLKDMPELERYILHKLWQLGEVVREGYRVYDYKKIHAALTHFMTADLSAFYFDIRKDSLYCDPLSATRRRACRTVLDQLFHCLTTWWAPILAFTAEEVWLSRFPGEASSVHLMPFAKAPEEWQAPELEKKWTVIRNVRRAVTGALELERAAKRIGSSLEAAPAIYVKMEDWAIEALRSVDLAELCITSGATLEAGDGPADAFRLDDLKNVAVVPSLAQGKKCARSWKITPEVGIDAEFPDITPRDAEAVREWQTRHKRNV